MMIQTPATAEHADKTDSTANETGDGLSSEDLERLEWERGQVEAREKVNGR